MSLTSSREILLVEVAGGRYGIDSDVVRELILCVSETSTPSLDAEGRTCGVIDLRGEVVPVVDLRCRLGLPSRLPLPSDHMVITRCGGGGAVAVRVDRALELARLEMATGEDGGGTPWARHAEGLIPVLAARTLTPTGWTP